MTARVHRLQHAGAAAVAAESPLEHAASARAIRAQRRADISVAAGRIFERHGVTDAKVAADAGVRRQVVTEWCRPDGAKNIGLAEASLVEHDGARAELAQLVAGDTHRVVLAPAPTATRADLASLMRLADGWAKLLHSALAAHADGHLDPAERRELLELVRGHRDATHSLELALAADELPGERR